MKVGIAPILDQSDADGHCQTNFSNLTDLSGLVDRFGIGDLLLDRDEFRVGRIQSNFRITCAKRLSETRSTEDRTKMWWIG